MSFHAFHPSSLHARRTFAATLAALALSIGGSAIAQQDFGQAPPPAAAPNGYPPVPANGYPNAPTNTYPSPQNQAYPPVQGNPAGTPTQSGYPADMAPGGNGHAGAHPPPQGGYGTGGNTGMQGNPLQQLVQAELQDYGVPPQQTLQANLHGPTPTRIPGGEVITTDRVIGLVQQNMQGQNASLVFHVLGPGPRLPGAENAGPASQAGSFNDATQQEFGRYLQQVTGGDKSRPMLFYCQNTQCWMSYNAALRAIAMGYSRVYWYRGGIEAWQQAEALAMSMQPQGQMPLGQPQAQPAGWR